VWIRYDTHIFFISLTKILFLQSSVAAVVHFEKDFWPMLHFLLHSTSSAYFFTLFLPDMGYGQCMLLVGFPFLISLRGSMSVENFFPCCLIAMPHFLLNRVEYYKTVYCSHVLLLWCLFYLSVLGCS